MPTSISQREKARKHYPFIAAKGKGQLKRGASLHIKAIQFLLQDIASRMGINQVLMQT